MAKKVSKVFAVHYCIDCRFGVSVGDFMYRCSKTGKINHSPICGLYNKK